MSRHGDYKCMNHTIRKDSEGQCQGDPHKERQFKKVPEQT